MNSNGNSQIHRSQLYTMRSGVGDYVVACVRAFSFHFHASWSAFFAPIVSTAFGLWVSQCSYTITQTCIGFGHAMDVKVKWCADLRFLISHIFWLRASKPYEVNLIYLDECRHSSTCITLYVQCWFSRPYTDSWQYAKQKSNCCFSVTCF